MRLELRDRVRGFTLMEMMLVMLILTLLVGAIFGIVRGTVELADDMTVEQARESRLRGFADYCERLFRTLPAGAVVRHELENRGGRYLSQLVFENVPSGVGASGVDPRNRVVLQTEEAVDGYLRMVLTVTPLTQDASEPVKLTLLEGVVACEWEFHDPVTDQWVSIWNKGAGKGLLAAPRDLSPPVPGAEVSPSDPGVKRPELVKLKLRLGASGERQFAFWTPPARGR